MSELGKLKPDFKEKWLAALESGEYPQSRQQLFRARPHPDPNVNLPAGYCCLGAAVKIMDSYVSCLHENAMPDRRDSEQWWDALPTCEQHNNPHVMFNGELRALSDLNDSGMSFAEIAKLIREQL